MTKAELIKELAVRGGASQVLVGNILSALADAVHTELRNGNEITLPEIGKLVPKTRPGRTGRNPKTGESVQVAEINTAKFKPAKHLLDTLNARLVDGGSVKVQKAQ